MDDLIKNLHQNLKKQQALYTRQFLNAESLSEAIVAEELQRVEQLSKLIDETVMECEELEQNRIQVCATISTRHSLSTQTPRIESIIKVIKDEQAAKELMECKAQLQATITKLRKIHTKNELLLQEALSTNSISIKAKTSYIDTFSRYNASGAKNPTRAFPVSFSSLG